MGLDKMGWDGMGWVGKNEGRRKKEDRSKKEKEKKQNAEEREKEERRRKQGKMGASRARPSIIHPHLPIARPSGNYVNTRVLPSISIDDVGLVALTFSCICRSFGSLCCSG